MSPDTLRVDAFVVGPLQECCYLAIDTASNTSVLIDPGYEAERLAEAVRASGATLTAIWLTHAHVDHVGAVAPLVDAFDVPVALHPLDMPLYERAAVLGERYGMSIPPLPDPTIDLAEGESVRLGSLEFAVRHLPGHAPGHVAFVGQGLMFSGDLVFAGSIGRTDLPLSDPRAMKQSLARIAQYPRETVVYPGHGPSTSIARELATNPFLAGLARPIGS